LTRRANQVHFDILGKDYTARAETRSGFSDLCRVDCKSGFVLPKLVRRIFSKFDSSGNPNEMATRGVRAVQLFGQRELSKAFTTLEVSYTSPPGAPVPSTTWLAEKSCFLRSTSSARCATILLRHCKQKLARAELNDLAQTAGAKEAFRNFVTPWLQHWEYVHFLLYF
jgi:hypothetical protein